MPVIDTNAWPEAIESFDVGAALGAVPATITSSVLIERGEEPPSVMLADLAVHFSPAFKLRRETILLAADTVTEKEPL